MELRAMTEGQKMHWVESHRRILGRTPVIADAKSFIELIQE